MDSIERDDLRRALRVLEFGQYREATDDDLAALGYVRLDPHGDLRRLRLALRKHGHEDGLRAALLEWLDGEET